MATEATFAWRRPEELIDPPESPHVKDHDPALRDIMRSMMLGETFPGTLAPETIFTDWPIISVEEQSLIQDHCKKFGYSPRFCSMRGCLVFTRLDRPYGLEPLVRNFSSVRKTKPQRIGFVYFLESKKTNLVKVGYSDHVATRKENLERSHGAPLNLIGFISNCTFKDEARIRASLSRFRRRGEWFRRCPELLEAINSIIKEATQCNQS